MSDILVVGSANIDLVAEVPHLPGPGETVLGSRLSVHEGGKGANQAVAAARAGGSVAFLGCVGRDEHGGRLRHSLRAAGVETGGLLEREETTGTALICVDAAGQNCIAVLPGANALLSPEQLRREEAAFGAARTLLLQLEIPLEAVAAAARMGAERGMLVILNPAPARPLPASLLRDVGVLTPNETEAALLIGRPVAGREGAAAAAEALLALGPDTVVVTLGAEGAFLATRAGLRAHVAAFATVVVDTTAAGDVFNGALAVALTEGVALEPAVRFACAAAAISISRRGAQPSAPARAEIDALLRGA
jgi:ribokinase